MAKMHVTKKVPLDKSTVQKILSSVTYDKGFHFFTAVGCYTGETATSLQDFGREIGVIDADSVKFHFKRHDFRKWIEDVIGDVELAERIDQIKEDLSEEALRKEIAKTVVARLSELKTFSQSAR
jgi:hypothetical protein